MGPGGAGDGVLGSMPGPFAASCPLPLPCGLLHTTRRFTRGSGDRIKPAGAGRHGWRSGGSSGSDSGTTPRRPRHGQAGANSRQSGRARGARAGAAGKARRALPAGECAPRSVPRATSREHTAGRAGPHGGHREEASVGRQAWSRVRREPGEGREFEWHQTHLLICYPASGWF